MTLTKKILYAVLAILVVIQFIRPAKNEGELEGQSDISKKYEVPADVHAILKTSCYDCHSNKTTYPWYVNIQPIGWWLQHHVNEGKEELNFSEFATYTEKRAKHKFEEIADEVKEGEMPISSYTIIHHNAVLTAEQNKLVVEWAEKLK